MTNVYSNFNGAVDYLFDTCEDDLANGDIRSFLEDLSSEESMTVNKINTLAETVNLAKAIICILVDCLKENNESPDKYLDILDYSTYFLLCDKLGIDDIKISNYNSKTFEHSLTLKILGKRFFSYSSTDTDQFFTVSFKSITLDCEDAWRVFYHDLAYNSYINMFNIGVFDATKYPIPKTVRGFFPRGEISTMYLNQDSIHPLYDIYTDKAVIFPNVDPTYLTLSESWFNNHQLVVDLTHFSSPLKLSMFACKVLLQSSDKIVRRKDQKISVPKLYASDIKNKLESI